MRYRYQVLDEFGTILHKCEESEEAVEIAQEVTIELGAKTYIKNAETDEVFGVILPERKVA